MAKNQPTPLETLSIGIDLGATKIAGALVSSTGHILEDREVPTHPAEGPTAVIGRIGLLVNQLADEANHSSTPLIGAGIGTPGCVDIIRGVVSNAINLAWQEVRLVEELRSYLPELPIWIGKDADANALGEYYFGAARGCTDFVYISIGSGLGCGIFSGGRLLTGSSGYAGELGHLSLDPDGLPCACGRHGCAETILSGPGLVALFKRMSASNRVSDQTDIEETTPKQILNKAQRNDKLSVAVLAEFGRHLGTVIAICTSLLNPEMIVVGGGLGQAAFNWIILAARQELARLVLPIHAFPRIAPSLQKTSALGAASLGWYYKERR